MSIEKGRIQRDIPAMGQDLESVLQELQLREAHGGRTMESGYFQGCLDAIPGILAYLLGVRRYAADVLKRSTAVRISKEQLKGS